jgi:hypothetical protein
VDVSAVWEYVALDSRCGASLALKSDLTTTLFMTGER